MQRIAIKLGFNRSLSMVIPFAVIGIIFIIVPLILIIIKAFSPLSGESISTNWFAIGSTIGFKILKSFFAAFIATFICFIIGYLFSYFVAKSNSKIFMSCAILLIVTPMWLSLLIKLIGLKITLMLFFTGGNELSGVIWTMIGLVYVYLPFIILPTFTSIKELPKNLIEASTDLGRKGIYTFFNVIIPWTKNSIIAGILLVFLPTFTSVAIPQFLDHSSTGQMIGNIIYDYGQQGFVGDVPLANAASLSIVVAIILFVIYLIIVWLPKGYSFLIQKIIINYKKKLLIEKDKQHNFNKEEK